MVKAQARVHPRTPAQHRHGCTLAGPRPSTGTGTPSPTQLMLGPASVKESTHQAGFPSGSLLAHAYVSACSLPPPCLD